MITIPAHWKQLRELITHFLQTLLSIYTEASLNYALQINISGAVHFEYVIGKWLWGIFFSEHFGVSLANCHSTNAPFSYPKRVQEALSRSQYQRTRSHPTPKTERKRMPVEISSESWRTSSIYMHHNATLSRSNEDGKHDVLQVTNCCLEIWSSDFQLPLLSAYTVFYLSTAAVVTKRRFLVFLDATGMQFEKIGKRIQFVICVSLFYTKTLKPYNL
jgi:hypothetical protein